VKSTVTSSGHVEFRAERAKKYRKIGFSEDETKRQAR
jgi:hypothetical protein